MTVIDKLAVTCSKENMYDTVHVHKINSFQGNQASVVIIDLVVDKKIGFLNKPNHINVWPVGIVDTFFTIMSLERLAAILIYLVSTVIYGAR